MEIIWNLKKQLVVTRDPNEPSKNIQSQIIKSLFLVPGPF